MRVENVIRKTIEERGFRQKWVIEKMNLINPDIRMNRNKFSAIVCGYRKMSGDELIAFCRATETNPDIFLESEKKGA